MESSVVPVLAAKPSAVRYLACLRLREVLVLQGSPLVGALFALASPAPEHLAPLALLLAASVCLVAHVFVLNDWANVTADVSDPTKAAWVFTARGIARREMAVIATVLLITSLLLFARIGPATLALALGIAAVSALYSLPVFDWKGRPLLSSLAHLTGGILHFLLGYSVAHAVDRRGLLSAGFFAAIFAAGHLIQELRDFSGDERNGIRTNAVVFGRRRTFAASLALFTIAQAMLLALSLTGTLPRPLAALVLLYPLQLWWSFQAFAGGLTYAGICRLQARYRALYAVIGLAMVAAFWLD